MKSARLFFGQYFPNIDLCAVNIDSQEEFEELTQGEEGGKTDYYEGDFFRVPIEESQTQLAPMKVTYINLLNVINAPDYDLTEAAKVIEKDPALVISLLEIVNRMSVNSEITSVKHAAAMLGQKELKKWINTAVTKELCSDKPSEIMRLSMIRAKYCENLAPLFDQAVLAPELFLMGLFSFLDIMVEKTMEEALKMITVSKNVENALLKGEGPLAPILEFVKAYENADWTESSRLLLLNSLKSDEVYRPYLEALSWYRDIFPEK